MAEDQTEAPAGAPAQEAADPEKDALKAQVAELQAALSDATDKLEKAEKALKGAKNGWKSDVKEMQAKLDAAAAANADKPVCEGHHVFLDGQKHDIIWRSTVKDLSIEGYQKRGVNESATAIVIVKEGG